jgi:serine/threonine protein kinase
LRPAKSIGIEQQPTDITIIDDRYILQDRLGGGGMGIVYVARDLLLEKHRDGNPYVALKLITESFRSNVEMRTLLQRECSRAQQLSHPNIIRVFYFGCEKARDLDYLTMELLHGKSLEQLIQSNPAGIDWTRSSTIIEQLCAGLEYAHGNGIVHSDVKPSNLFVTQEEVLKILDFGIAARLRGEDKASAETIVSARRFGAISERYSSFEMHLGMEADPSDDVYSAACVVYEVLTGRHPYREMSAPLAAEKNLKVASIPSLSQGQNAALRKALRFRRAERTGKISELRQGLLESRGPPAKLWYAGGAGAAVVCAAAVWYYGGGSSIRDLRPPASNAGTPLPIAQRSPEPVFDAKIPLQPPPQAVRAEPPVVASPKPASTRAPRPVNVPDQTIDPASSRSAATAKKPTDRRCESIEEHSQLGENLNDEDRAYFNMHCQ